MASTGPPKPHGFFRRSAAARLRRRWSLRNIFGMEVIMKNSACLTLILLSLFVNQAFACTTFCLKGKGEVLFGGNYDWEVGDALVLVNKRGVAKTATIIDSDNGAKWVSKYGSVTFNQYGRENPTGGMNEEGLVVQQMWLSDTEYPKVDARPAIGTQEWIQYLLDNSATSVEAIKNAEAVRIESEVKVHYLIDDNAGNAATVEFLKGMMVVHTGTNLAPPTLTNDTYDNSLNYAKQIDVAKASSNESLDRFTRAFKKTTDFEKRPLTNEQAVAYAFEVLSDVAQKDRTETWTQWSIVYDQKRSRIYFRTKQSSQIKSVDIKAFDYSCGTPVKMLDMNAKEGGDVTAKFTDYTRKANRDLIERSFNGTSFLKSVTAMERVYMASYPESFKCSSTK
jgi:choloylglycine hydrolase